MLAALASLGVGPGPRRYLACARLPHVHLLSMLVAGIELTPYRRQDLQDGVAVSSL